MTEQSNDQSKGGEQVQSLDDFKKLSLDDMEKELKAPKAVSKPAQESEDQDQQNSETSEEDSKTEETDKETQTEEQTSEEENSEQSEESSESDETSDNQNKDKSKNKTIDYEKAYKELQAEFTRRNQKQKEYEAKLAELEAKLAKSPEKKDEGDKKPSKLAQLKAKDPDAAALLEELIDEQVEKRVNDRVKPVEEQVTIRRRQENANKFSKEIEAFKASELGGLETELLGIWNENPSFWQQVVWDDEDAFSQLKKELIFRHLDKVTELRSKKLKENQSASTKTERLKGSQVATKTKVTQATRDVMSDDDFRKLPLSEMEKRLPKNK
jgi:hypothetical protein